MNACTGYVHERTGTIHHDGDTCPIHERSKMNNGIERYEVVAFGIGGGEPRTYGVMAYAHDNIPLGIDAHWHHRADAEMALRHYATGAAAHGRTTEREHREIHRQQRDNARWEV